VIVSGSATYKLTDWLTALVRTGTDTYRYNINADYAQGNIELNNGSTTVNPAYAGAFANVTDNYTENNTDALLTAVTGALDQLLRGCSEHVDVLRVAVPVAALGGTGHDVAPLLVGLAPAAAIGYGPPLE